MNDSKNYNFFKENQLNNNIIAEINIIYKILLLFLGEKKLVEISNDNLFWSNCRKYLIDKSKDGKIGTMINNNIKNFNFEHKTINSIELILFGNKNNIINGYYEKLCKTTGLIIPLIKEALEFCGIIINEKNKKSFFILDNLIYNQNLINKINNIIKESNK